MKKTFLLALAWLAMQPASGNADAVSPVEIETAWLAFTNARGAASLIQGDLQHPSANDIFRIIPDMAGTPLDEARQELGSELFRETRLSKDGSVACASCHVDMMGGVDHRPLPFGIGGAQGEFNAPTTFNAALNFRQFWDGRALTLQDQALGPIQNPLEFGHDLDGAVATLAQIPEYATAFATLYPDGVTAANLADAIAYYETMTFTGLESPFLRQFHEQPDPLSRQARRGQQRFVEVGCAACHNGINLGGNSFQQLGVAQPWYGVDRPAREPDDGLFRRTGREQDRHVFKVPGLHYVAATGPWFHDGSIASLQQAVDRMARHQSGRYLENQDIDDIVAFLRALGDSLGMIGDCSASGTYGVTMTCTMSKRTSGAAQDEDKAPVALPDAAVLAGQHQAEYSDARERVAAAPARITQEMRRIRSGQVAHFDFLQYEHIEMARHARALSFPPAGLDPQEHADLLAEAARWQESAGDYELAIADFLRTEAVANSARANIQDLLKILSVDAGQEIEPLLAQAEESALAFHARPGPDTRQVLELRAGALQDLELDSRRLEEFQLQVRLLLDNAPGG